MFGHDNEIPFTYLALSMYTEILLSS